MEIRLRNVEVRVPAHGRLLFRIRSWTVPSGARVLIEGASGIGKTTLLHLVAGLFRPEAGEVHLGPHALHALPDEARCRIRRENIGLVFQRLNLLEHLTPVENVLLGLPPGRASLARARGALERLGLRALADARSAALSLGEQQRVAVARVVAAHPAVILADEPTSSLDQANADVVLDALFDAAHGSTLVIVSHDRRLQPRFDRVTDFAEVTAP